MAKIKIKPLGDRVLLRPIQPKDSKTKSGIMFGMNLIPQSKGTISINDSVTILK